MDAERYEFAELSWGNTPNVADCTLSLFTYPPDHPNMGETYFAKPWMDVLGDLGTDGWHIGAGMVYENIRVLILQRKVRPPPARRLAGADWKGTVMDEANALYMARRVMRRNLERAKDAQSICDNDLLRSIILESTMWLHDFDTPEPSSKVDERCKHENTELNPYNSVFYCQDCGEAITTKFIIEGGKGQGE